jgi:zinc D-Ala-D-Ala dipeptidase
MRPYHNIQIIESGEPLVKIPFELFAVESPHPYEKLGAPYSDRSPYYLREGVINGLIEAQNYLETLRPNWKIQIFDAYRPVEVQQFMVDYSFELALQERNWLQQELSLAQEEEIWQAVYDIWAPPNMDLKTPPPHSTGAAVDVTLVNSQGKPVDMGSFIDEMSQRSLPDYYQNSDHSQGNEFHHNRELLKDVMEKGGLLRNPREWWHFSYGDQMWAWIINQSTVGSQKNAFYGRL